MKLYDGKEIMNNNKKINKYHLFVVIFSVVLLSIILVLFLTRKYLTINYTFLKILLVVLSLILALVDFFVFTYYIGNIKKINKFYSYINKGQKEIINDKITKIEEITMQGIPCLELLLSTNKSIFVEKNKINCVVDKEYRFMTSAGYVIEVDNYD